MYSVSDCNFWRVFFKGNNQHYAETPEKNIFITNIKKYKLNLDLWSWLATTLPNSTTLLLNLFYFPRLSHSFITSSQRQSKLHNKYSHNSFPPQHINVVFFLLYIFCEMCDYSIIITNLYSFLYRIFLTKCLAHIDFNFIFRKFTFVRVC